MIGRSFQDTEYDSYRFGFNGKENDTDFGNKQLIQDYGFRLYNPAIAKFLSVDPLFKEYPWYTPYQFAGNKPIWAIDLDGLEELPWYLTKNEYGGKPVLTLGLGTLPLYGRMKYDVNNYDAKGQRANAAKANTFKFIVNAGGSAWNNVASTWNQARAGKSGAAMLEESNLAIGRFVDTAKAEEWEKLATNPITYENITGQIATAWIAKKITKQSGIKAKSPSKGGLSDVDARKWYLKQEASIPSLLDKSLSVQGQAKQAFNLRNKFRTDARKLMANQVKARQIAKDNANLTWNEIVSKTKAKGFEGNNVYKEIINSSQRSRKSVNDKLGVKPNK